MSSSDPRAGAAWLDDLALNDFGRCASLPDASYRRSLDGLDKPLVDGHNICIRTGEHNIAIVRLDEPSTADAPGLDLHYAIQYRVFEVNPARHLYERLGFHTTGLSGGKVHMRLAPG